MRKLASILCALLMLPLVAAPAHADPYVDNAAIDELLDQLVNSRNEMEADDISRQIWSYWFSPSDPELAAGMQVAGALLSQGNAARSLAELDTIVAKFPDYAEGWNQRATVLYILGRLDESLADIEKVLAIEPRHYGALSGRVLIYLKQGKRDDALAAMRAALAIHPFLSERRHFPELAQDVTHV